MWEFLAKIFSNAWVVGIVGGIISGIIVYFITKWIFQRKDNSKYLELINNANMDIIRSLKPYIAEKGLPEKEIIDAIILSTARKYKVKSEELYSIRIVCEELIREIVENVYVSSDKKEEYTKHLKDYLHNLNVERDKSLLITEIEKEIKNSANISKIEYKKKLVSTLSVMISMMAAILTMFTTLLTDSFSFTSHLTNEMEIILIVTVVTISTLSLSMVLMMLLKFRDKVKDREKDDSQDNPDNK